MANIFLTATNSQYNEVKLSANDTITLTRELTSLEVVIDSSECSTLGELISYKWDAGQGTIIEDQDIPYQVVYDPPADATVDSLRVNMEVPENGSTRNLALFVVISP